MMFTQHIECGFLAVLAVHSVRMEAVAGIDGVGAYYEDAMCTKTTIATINPGACLDNQGCKAYQSTGIFLFCVDETAEYLESAFGNSPYLMTEEYSDAQCSQLYLIRALFSDAKCHVGHEDDGAMWTMNATVAEDGTVSVLEWNNCGGSVGIYSLEPISNQDLNTVVPVFTNSRSTLANTGGMTVPAFVFRCPPVSSASYSAKYYYVDPSSSSLLDSKGSSTKASGSTDTGSWTGSSDMSSSNSSDGANTTTDPTPSSGPATTVVNTSLTLMCVLLAAFGMVAR